MSDTHPVPAGQVAERRTFKLLCETLASVRRAGFEPRVNRRRFRISWTDQAGKRHFLEPLLTPDERGSLQNPE